MSTNRGLGLQNYKHKIKMSWLTLGILFVLLLAFIIMAICLGVNNISFVEAMQGLFGVGEEDFKIIVWEFRMPRIVTAVLAGAGLALAGCIMQTCLGNPLASPTTIGVGSAATFGANIAIIGFGAAGLGSGSSATITTCAFVCALGSVLIVMLISKFQHFTPEAIILAGTALSAIFAAGTALLQYGADENDVAAAVFWTFGNLGNLPWYKIGIIGATLVVCFVFFMFQSWNYNTMNAGEESAKSLGLKTPVIRVLGLLFATLLTAVIVSMVGMIGFVGLVGPHIMKRIIGSDHRFFVPASTLAGAIILLLADTTARMVLAPKILPVGAITSLIGAPVLIFILLKGLRKR